MAVKHTKVATVTDDGTSEVGTNEWNDNHVIDNNTITDDMVVAHTTTKIVVPVAKVTGLATSATTDTTSAANIGSGTLPLARLTGITTSNLSATAGITSGQLAGSIAPSKVTGTAAILGANVFTGSQTIPPNILKSQGIAGLGGLTFEPTATNGIQNTCFNPSGTGNRSQITISRQSDPTVNADSLAIGGDIYNTSTFAIRTYSSGTGTTRDLQFFHGTTNLMQLTSSGLTFSSTLNMGGNNIDSVKNIDHNVSAITHSASNTILNFALDQVQYLSVNANTTFTTSNILAGKSKTIKVIADGTDRVLTFPAAFRWVGTAPTNNTHTITAGKLAVLTMTCFADASDANVLCAFALEE